MKLAEWNLDGWIAVRGRVAWPERGAVCSKDDRREERVTWRGTGGSGSMKRRNRWQGDIHAGLFLAVEAQAGAGRVRGTACGGVCGRRRRMAGDRMRRRGVGRG